MKDAGLPLLSILIPTWNRKNEALKAIRSVGVVTSNIEIIVVEDGSDESNYLYLCDASKDIGNVYVYRNDQNLGMVRNWNKCISYARGQWVGMLCDDDCYRPDAIDRVLSLLAMTKHPTLILQDTRIEDKYIFCPKGQKTVSELRLPIASGNFWHRDIIEKVGVFDERFHYSADAEYWYRVASEFPVIKIKDPVAIYNQHSSNYMWSTWRKSDFIAQTSLLANTVGSYIYSESVTKESDIQKYVDLALWGTYLAIIEQTVMSKDKLDIFRIYMAHALAGASTYLRKFELAKRLISGVLKRTL